MRGSFIFSLVMLFAFFTGLKAMELQHEQAIVELTEVEQLLAFLKHKQLPDHPAIRDKCRLLTDIYVFQDPALIKYPTCIEALLLFFKTLSADDIRFKSLQPFIQILAQAALAANRVEIVALFVRHTDLHAMRFGKYNCTALSYVAQNGGVELVSFLLLCAKSRRGADFNVLDDLCNTVLDSVEMTERLYKKDPNALERFQEIKSLLRANGATKPKKNPESLKEQASKVLWRTKASERIDYIRSLMFYLHSALATLPPDHRRLIVSRLAQGFGHYSTKSA